jgi:hypothetical protein
MSYEGGATVIIDDESSVVVQGGSQVSSPSEINLEGGKSHSVTSGAFRDECIHLIAFNNETKSRRFYCDCIL